MSRNLRALFWVVAAALSGQLLSALLPPYFSTIFVQVGIAALLALSLNLITGIAGQFSLGHAGFMAVGAYCAALLSTTLLAPLFATPALSHLGLLLGLLLSGGLAALAGWLVGQPSLRLRGDYLAIVTLGFGEIIRVLILNSPALGGARGFTSIPPVGDALLGPGFWVYLCLSLSVVALVRLMASTHGRALLAVREDEIAAQSLGVDVTAYKVRAFTLSSGLAGVAGALFAHVFSYLNPSSFTFMKSVEVLVMVVLGGMGSMSGALFAAVILTLLPEALRPLRELTGVDLRMVLYSLTLILLMLFRPQGLLGRKEAWQLWSFNKKGPV